MKILETLIHKNDGEMSTLEILIKKGVLAIDESTTSVHKKFEKLGIWLNQENRVQYRLDMMDAPQVEKHIGGVILYDEVFNNKKIRESAARSGILLGIKVDQGLEKFMPKSDEQVTKGLIGLEKRLKDYKKKGAVFTKWRSVFHIGRYTPSDKLIKINTNILSEYATTVIDAGLIPIVEPEILIDGNYTIERYSEIAKKIYKELFDKMPKKNISKMILKTGFASHGKKNNQVVSIEEKANTTIDIFKNSVPSDIGGIVFLSGGVSAEESRALLSTIQSKKHGLKLSFSFGRALQDESIKFWNTDKDLFFKEFKDVLEKNTSANRGDFKG